MENNLLKEKKGEKNIPKDEKTKNSIVKEASKIVEEKNKQKNIKINSSKKEINTDEISKHSITSENTHKNEQIKKYESNSKKKKIIISVILIILVLLVLILSTIFGVIVSNSNKIVSGVSICGIDISNLTQSQAVEKLNRDLSGRLDRSLTLKHNEYTTSIETKALGASYSVENAVSEAYGIGRSENNIFSNNYKALGTMIGKKNIIPQITYDNNSLDEFIDKINSELPDRVINSSYKIENDNLIVSNSSSGNRIQNESFKNAIQSALTNNESSIEIPVEQYEADTVDIDAIYKEVHKEPIDATFTEDPFEIHKEENGLDFAISLDKAKELISQPQDSYTIPLKVLTPKVTVKNLPQEAFPDLLATYSTTYASSNYNRSSNIALAARSVNNYVLMPNETFSYNSTVGQRTAARGYKEAGVYVNGTVSTDYGGGICQVSSTLYNSVLLSNLEVVARSNHTFEPSYVPAGQDATVSWGSPDFQFKNNRAYPIRIVTTAGGGRITASIYGVKSNDDYEVKIQSTKTGIIPFSTEYKDDSSLPAGTTKVSQAGSNGCTSQTYKILYKNGAEVSRKLINSDTYKPHNQVILRGTKTVSTPAPTPTPTPTPTPAPTTSPSETNNNNSQTPSTPTQTETPADSGSSSVSISNVPQE